MSPQTIPFHLRPNKHIDRRLFVEALRHVGHVKDLRNFGYVTLGGAFLEDCWEIFMDLGIERLLSTERDKREFARQAFNKPLNFIQCCNLEAAEFIAALGDHLQLIGSPNNIISWLDFQERDRNAQLSDVALMVTKLAEFDVLRVTMNAALGTLKGLDRADRLAAATPSLERRHLELARVELGTHFPEDATSADFVSERYPSVLSRAIYSAARSGLQQGLSAVPITNLAYRDGQQMLSVTLILLREGSKNTLLKRSRLLDWAFFSSSAGRVHRIDVPALSVRERVEIDHTLASGSPGNLSEEILKIFERDEIERYQRFRRYFPTYGRISV